MLVNNIYPPLSELSIFRIKGKQNQGNAIVPRDEKLDSLKFYLIVLVIIGHVISADAVSGINASIHNFIYLFHMPLFSILSGYFTSTSKGKHMNLQSIKDCFFLFLIFHLLQLLTWKHFDFSWKDVLSPQYAMWYLLALCYWRLLVVYLPKKWNLYYIFTGSIMLGLLIGFVPLSGFLGLRRAIAYAPFFFMGHLIKKYKMMDILKKQSDVVAYAIICTGLFCSLLINRNLSVILYTEDYPNGNTIYIVLRIAFYIFSAILSIAIIKVTPSTSRMAWWGKNSLFFYLWHTFFIYVLYKLIHKFDWSTSLEYCLFYSLAIIIVLFIMFRIKIFHYFFIPFSALKLTKNAK